MGQVVLASVQITLKAAATGIGLGLPLALLLGIPAGLRPGSRLDRALQAPAVALSGVPAFVAAMLAFWLLLTNMRLTSMIGATRLTMALLLGAWMARAVRNGLGAARVDGAPLAPGRAALSVLGRILQQGGNLLMVNMLIGHYGGGSGSELWRLAFSGAMTRDYPVVYGALWAMVAIVLTGHLLGDLLVTAVEKGRPETEAAAQAVAPAMYDAVRRSGPPLSRIWLVTGAALFALLLLMPLVGGGDPTAIDLKDRLRPPSAAHLLGTDSMGRDLLNRVGSGARTSLTIAMASSLLGAVGGVMLAGAGRAAGRWGMALLSPRIAVPGLLAPLVAGLVGGLLWKPSVLTLMITLGISSIPAMALAWRQLFQHLGSGPVPARAVAATGGLMLLTFAQILLAEVTLSFAGLGILPPTASLGSVIAEGMNYIRPNPYLLWAAAPSSLGLAGLFLAGHALAGEEA